MADEAGGIQVPIGLDDSGMRVKLVDIGVLIRGLMGDAERFGAVFDGSLREIVDQLKIVQKLAGAIRTGGPDALAANSGVAGAGAQLRGSDTGQLLELDRQRTSLAQQLARYARDAADTLALERGETERTTAVDKARLEVAQRLREVRDQVAKGPGALGVDQTLPLVERLTAAYRGLDLAQQAQRREAAEARVTAEKEKQLALDRQAAEAENRQVTLRSRAAGVVDPQLALQNAAGRTAAADRLFGDGGQHLFEIQARLYAQYFAIRSVISGAQGLVQGVFELDQAMRQLQAISGATDTQMQGLQATILAVGQTSRFSLNELTEAATTMAQAGLSAGQIDTALAGTVQLAAATGSSLKESVDIVTSALSVFNVRAEDTGKVANLVTSALNLSKLTVDKFATGLQYAGNIAADAGDDLTTVAAILATLSDAGIKSGSTLGTGLRQLYADFQKPSEQLQQRLQLLGVTAEQVDVRTNGLVGVIKNLGAAGFSSADAMQALGTRGAAAYTALVRNLDRLDSLDTAFRGAEGASAAVAVQMEGGIAKLERFRNAAQSVAFVMAGDFDKALGRVADTGAASLAVLSEHKAVLEGVGTAAASLATGALLYTVARFTGLAAAAKAVAFGFGEIRTATTLAAAGTAALGVALNPVVDIALALFAAVGLLTNGFGLWGDKSDELAGRLETSKTRMNEAKERADAYQSSIAAVDAQLETVTTRAGHLSTDQGALNAVIQEAKDKFGELGFTIDGLPHSIEGLIAAYEKLRGSLEKGVAVEQKEVVQAAADQVKALQEKLNNVDAGPGTRALTAFGYQPAPTFLEGFRPPGAASPPDAATGLKAAQAVDPQLAAAVDLLTKRLDVDTPEKLQAVLDQFSAALGPIQDRIRTGGLSPELTQVLRDLKDALLHRLTLVNQSQEAQTKGDLAAKTADDSTFESGPGLPIDTALRTSRFDFESEKTSRLSGVTNQDDRQAIAKDIQEKELAKLDESIGDAIAKLPPVDQATAQRLFGDKIASARQAIIQGMGDVGAAAAKEIVKDDQAELQTVSAQIERASGKLGGKATGDDAAVLKAVDDLIRQKGELEKKVFAEQNYGKVTDDVIAKHDTEIDQQTKDSIGKLRDKAAETAKRVSQTQLGEQISLLSSEADLVERKFTGRNPKGTDADLARLKSLWDQLDAAAIARKKADGLDPASLQREIDIIKGKRAAREEDFIDRQAKATTTPAFEPKFFDPDLSSSLSKPFSLITKDFATQAKDLAAPLRALEAEISALDQPGVKENVPGFLKDQLGQKAQELQTQGYQQIAASAKAEQVAIQAQIDQLTQVMNDLIVQSGEMEAKLGEAAGQPKTPELDRLQTDYTQITARVQKLKEAIAGGQQALATSGEKADAALQAYQARIDAYNASQLSYAQTIKGSYQAWAQSAGVLDSGVKIIGDTATATFGALRDGIAGATVEITSRTKTIGQAFRDMGLSILQTLQKIAAERFADALIGLLANGLSAGLGYFGGAGGTNSVTSGVPLPGQLYSKGGYVTGGVAGKDSVPSLLTPGEFVLTKKAVDMLGRGNVEAIARSGRLAEAKVSSIAALNQGGGAAASPVNVYVVSPDQVPPPGEREIVAHVASNIQRGGPLKQLIRTVNR